MTVILADSLGRMEPHRVDAGLLQAGPVGPVHRLNLRPDLRPYPLKRSRVFRVVDRTHDDVRLTSDLVGIRREGGLGARDPQSHLLDHVLLYLDTIFLCLDS